MIVMAENSVDELEVQSEECTGSVSIVAYSHDNI